MQAEYTDIELLLAFMTKVPFFALIWTLENESTKADPAAEVRDALLVEFITISLLVFNAILLAAKTLIELLSVAIVNVPLWAVTATLENDETVTESPRVVRDALLVALTTKLLLVDSDILLALYRDMMLLSAARVKVPVWDS